MTEARLAAGTVDDIVAGGRADDTALVAPETGLALTYERLADDVSRLAGALRAVGVEPGDRVAVVLPNGLDIVEVLLAILSLGAGAAPLNPLYTREEHRFYLHDIAPRALVVPQGEYAAARAACPDSAKIVELGDRLRRVRSARSDAAHPDSVALLLHTSGTTSRPKLVPLLQRNLVAGAQSVAGAYDLSAADVSYCAMPLFHVHGLVASVLAQLAAGGTVVVPRRLAGSAFWQQVAARAATWHSASPAVHRMLLERAPEDAAGLPLRFVRSCSSALSPALMAELEARLGVPVVEAYGMTEACHQISTNPLPPEVRRPGTVGPSAGAEVRVVDERGRDVDDGHAGEVVIRGPGVTPGYLGDAAAGEAAFVGGWFRTGDLGVLERGYLRLSGRLKEIVIRGGENVSPLEVEEVLLAHPSVVDAVCFGMPSERYGEDVAAAVVLGAPAEQKELAAHCRERLAPFKMPRTIVVVDQIPRTATGKLQRRRVGALLGLL